MIKLTVGERALFMTVYGEYIRNSSAVFAAYSALSALNKSWLATDQKRFVELCDTDPVDVLKEALK